MSHGRASPDQESSPKYQRNPNPWLCQDASCMIMMIRNARATLNKNNVNMLQRKMKCMKHNIYRISCSLLYKHFGQDGWIWVLRISVYAFFGIPDVDISRFPCAPFHMPTAAVAATSEFSDPNPTSPNSRKDETRRKV